MFTDLITYWPFISSFGGMLVGGLVTWTTTKIKVEQLFQQHSILEKRVGALEGRIDRDRLDQVDRMARVEVMLTDVRAAVLRLEQK